MLSGHTVCSSRRRLREPAEDQDARSCQRCLYRNAKKDARPFTHPCTLVPQTPDLCRALSSVKAVSEETMLQPSPMGRDVLMHDTTVDGERARRVRTHTRRVTRLQIRSRSSGARICACLPVSCVVRGAAAALPRARRTTSSSRPCACVVVSDSMLSPSHALGHATGYSMLSLGLSVVSVTAVTRTFIRYSCVGLLGESVHGSLIY